MIEAIYGETMTIEAAVEMLAREEWLEYRHDTSLMVIIPESTPMWALYMIFFCFHDIKIYMYYIFKSICIIKGTLVLSLLSLIILTILVFFYSSCHFSFLL